jgi:hypothetical protein
MRVLLTGFGPFPGVPLNPSALLVKALARRRRPAFAAITRTTHVFATAYEAVDRDLPKLFAQKPDIILMFGLAGSATSASRPGRATRFRCCIRMPADTAPSAALSFVAHERCKAARRSPICSVRCEVAQSPPASLATPGDIFATTPIGGRWTAPATVTRWFSSFIFRASDLIRGAGAKAARLLSVRW